MKTPTLTAAEFRSSSIAHCVRGAMTMAKRMSRLTVDKCDKCALIGGDRKVGEDLCTAFEFPEYQWRNGECWGRCESIDEMIRRLQAIISYNECHGMNTAGVARLKKELAGWLVYSPVKKG